MTKYRKVFACRWCGYPEVPVAGSWQLCKGHRYQTCPNCFRTEEVQNVRKVDILKSAAIGRQYECAHAYKIARLLFVNADERTCKAVQKEAAYESLRERKMRGVE